MRPNNGELQAIIQAHRQWLGNQNMGKRADLSRADLSEADLSEADLSGADLSRADLGGANLGGADLSGADLSRANLSRADLSRADLSRSNLSGANLGGVNLKWANLSGANLSRADLKYAKLPHFSVCPEKGSFIAFKKVSGSIVIELIIPEDAKRISSLVSRKCRADKAIPVAAYNLDMSINNGLEFASEFDRSFIYRLNEMAVVEDFNSDIRIGCAEGIHFFITSQEAVEYV